MKSTPTVHILLATYNGEHYLEEQLTSIEQQTYQFWTLTVSDDGSTDNTLQIIDRFMRKVPQNVILVKGPNKRCSTSNFISLINKANSSTSTDLYAFCDQDDVWLSDKLDRAVNWHKKYLSNDVRLYCSRTIIVNEKLKPITLSTDLHIIPNFGNALLQNIASGNTMVFTHSVLSTLVKFTTTQNIWHDWSAYIVTTAMNGIVFFDNEPSLLYRQHSNNVIGFNEGVLAPFSIIKINLKGRYKERLDIIENNIIRTFDFLPPDVESLLQEFIMIRSTHNRFIRLYRFFKARPLRRNNTFSNMAIAFCVLFNLL
jgi:glycosyltransferase involved in cell wall biosynthesis